MRQQVMSRTSGSAIAIVRLPILKPEREAIRTLTELSAVHGGRISSENVAVFLRDQVMTSEWLHRASLITW
jgi:hypothetical protein